MPQTISQVMQQASFYSDAQPYHLIALPTGAVLAAAGVVAEIGEPFCALIVDKDEVTLLVPQEAWADLQHRLPGASLSPVSYRLITVDAILEPTLIGFMAYVSKALADAAISILAFAAYNRDHFFVPESQFDLALSIFEQLKSQA